LSGLPARTCSANLGRPPLIAIEIRSAAGKARQGHAARREARYDADKKTLTDFLARTPMPWIHWWNGAEGKLIDTLNILHYPTIFVLDGNGVIRFKEVRGEELDEAVNTLLEEAKGRSAKGT
jgi:hypothetical protein